MAAPASDRSYSFFHIVLLLALCGVLYFPYLGSTPMFDKGEPREALAVQDIVQRGEWLFPLKRATAIPSKPPMFHWSAALTYQVTGVLDEATIRFPSALYATLGVIFLYLLGAKLFGAQVGLLGGAILATTMIYQTQAVNARVDMTLCFFVTAQFDPVLRHLPRFLAPSAVALCDVPAGGFGDSFQRAVGDRFAGAGDRGLPRRQTQLENVFQIRLSSRCADRITSGRRLVWHGD